MKTQSAIANRFRELFEEFQLVIAGRNQLLDVAIPSLVFFIVDAFLGLRYAIISAIVIAVLTALIRLSRRQSLLYAFGGLIGVAVSLAITVWFGSDEGFFLPALFDRIWHGRYRGD